MALDRDTVRTRAISSNTMRSKLAALVFASLLVPTAGLAVEPATAEPRSPYIEGLLKAFATEPAERLPISLQNAVAIAVANNPGVLALRRVPESAAYGVLGAEAVYEPTFRIEFAYTDSKVPTSDLLQGVEGAQLGDPREDDQYVADVALSKQLKTGTQLEVVWNNLRRRTNSSFEQLSPRYDPSIGVRLQQPLLRDFGGIDARTTVRMAENTTYKTAADYEAALGRFILDIVRAYWSYNLVEAELAAKELSLELAKELAGEARARVQIGSLPPVAAKEAESDAAAREEEVIEARNDLELRARDLQYKIMLPSVGASAPAGVRPGEEHRVDKTTMDAAEILAKAVSGRAEARAANLQIQSAKLEEKRAKNFLLPDLALFGRYDVVGLGGRNNSDFDPPSSAANRSERDAFSDAYDVLDSGDFFRYRVGIELEIPLSNAEARSRYAQAEIAVRRSEDEFRRIVSSIALEIQQSVGDVASAYKRVAAARLARELAAENLRDQKKRYEVGIVTTTDILDFQEKATNAMAAEARAIADHAIATAELRRAEGSLLEGFGVRVEFENSPGNEWWARF
jgi:outer membrane protein